jgi:hypothetical protein
MSLAIVDVDVAAGLADVVRLPAAPDDPPPDLDATPSFDQSDGWLPTGRLVGQGARSRAA